MSKEQVARLFDQWDQMLPNWHLYVAAFCFGIAALAYVTLVRVKKVPTGQVESAPDETAKGDSPTPP